MIHHPFPIILGLGSNLGAGRETFDQACAMLERIGVRVDGRSRLYRARPWGVSGQPDYLNAALAVSTARRPLELLDLCRHVEFELGRRRRRRWGARRLDMDIVLYGRLRLDHPRLRLPHPRIGRRDFVIAPLIDLGVPPDPRVAPGGWRALLSAVSPAERVIYHSEPWIARPEDRAGCQKTEVKRMPRM